MVMRIDQVDLHWRPADDERGDDGGDHFRHAPFAFGHLLAGGVAAQNADDLSVENGDDDQRHDQAENGEAICADLSRCVQDRIVLAKQADVHVDGRIERQDIVVDPASDEKAV